ncbi:integrin beta-1-binding protein 2 [Protobothrops mucrosquamatus]|uniref:integrin beta-1-binding protein 2 n=1 Tax=Protobothrops mucrosquamatus TaxID=103944 RepID=UPI0010FB581C|nr:integrin beta-1-binding protein 2 [Protobothrops mucrosquamatus]
MALLCYRKGCGQSFDPERNSQDACLHHPGFPIFHDALKGWSCCKKRTTDFSEFLSIKGCTKGYHSHEKPPEPEEASAKHKPCTEDLVLESKSAEVLQRERPSSDEPKQPLLVKVAQALQQLLEKLDTSSATQPAPHGLASPGGTSEASIGTACKNAGCQAAFQGEESKRETCLFHPGVPVFHEGMKYWSCCGIKTTDFAAFLEQKGCSRGKHTWVTGQKRVSCRQDWHQTSSQVVVTLYARTPLPHLSSIKANRTVLDIRVAFERDKIFQAQLDLWGVINVEKSFASLLPSKVEIALKKANPITWAGLEQPQSRGEACQPPPQEEATKSSSLEAPMDDSDDSLGWSEDEG